MGLLKQHLHDEICEAEEPHDPTPHGPFPMPPVHVVMERNAVTGDCTPVFVCNHLVDANAVALMRTTGRYLSTAPDALSLDYYVKEAVPCLGKPLCVSCGDTFAPARRNAGYHLCMPCGEQSARRVKHTVVPLPKSNYMLVTDPSLLVGLNSSHRGNR